MKKGQKTKRIPVLSILFYLVLVTALISGSASAKYVSQIGAQADSARVARFDVAVTSNDFPTGDVYLVMRNETATYKSYNFTVKNNSEVSVRYSVEIKDGISGTNGDKVILTPANGVLAVGGTGTFEVRFVKPPLSGTGGIQTGRESKTPKIVVTKTQID